MNVMIVGDTHIHHSTPSSRKDNYSQTVLDKLTFLKDYCKTNGVPFVVLLGDIFHTPSEPLSYLNKVIDLFKDWSNYSEIYTIIGNHDVPLGNVNRVDETALGNLFITGFVKHANGMFRMVHNKHFIGVDYKKDIPKVSATHNKGYVLFLHSFYESNDADSVSGVELDRLGYRQDHVFLGHDHTPYPIAYTEQKNKIIRIGSLTRGTSHLYQLTRKPSVMLWNLETDVMQMLEVPHVDANLIFTEISLQKDAKSIADSLSSIRETLAGWVESVKQDTKNDVYLSDLIKTLNISQEAKDIIWQYVQYLEDW